MVRVKLSTASSRNSAPKIPMLVSTDAVGEKSSLTDSAAWPLRS